MMPLDETRGKSAAEHRCLLEWRANPPKGDVWRWIGERPNAYYEVGCCACDEEDTTPYQAQCYLPSEQACDGEFATCDAAKRACEHHVLTGYWQPMMLETSAVAKGEAALLALAGKALPWKPRLSTRHRAWVDYINSAVEVKSGEYSVRKSRVAAAEQNALTPPAYHWEAEYEGFLFDGFPPKVGVVSFPACRSRAEAKTTCERHYVWNLQCFSASRLRAE